MKYIYLIRHAEPELGGRKHVCLGGRSDVPLSEEGARQAAKAAACFPDGLNLRIFASPMLRARQTAELISGGRWPVETLSGMEEIDCGEWDGLSFDEIRLKYPELYEKRGGDLSLTPPGGESLESVARRGMAALESLKELEEENIIVVAHKGMNRVLLCALMGRPVTDYRSLSQDYVCINTLRREGGSVKVESIALSPEDFKIKTHNPAKEEDKKI